MHGFYDHLYKHHKTTLKEVCWLGIVYTLNSSLGRKESIWSVFVTANWTRNILFGITREWVNNLSIKFITLFFLKKPTHFPVRWTPVHSSQVKRGLSSYYISSRRFLRYCPSSICYSLCWVFCFQFLRCFVDKVALLHIELPKYCSGP